MHPTNAFLMKHPMPNHTYPARTPACLVLATALLLGACSDDSGNLTGAGAKVATVEVSAPSTSLVSRETLQLSATAKDGSGQVLAGATLAWASSDTTVATVSETGVVSGVRAGEVTITASLEQVKGEFVLTVRMPTPSTTATTIHVNPGDPVLLSRPASEGEVVQYLGDRDGNGVPSKLRGLRRGSPTDARTGDMLALSAEGLPTSVMLRDGSSVVFAYGTDGKVIMTVAVPGSAPIQQTFQWRSSTAAGASQLLVSGSASGGGSLRTTVSTQTQAADDAVQVSFQLSEPDAQVTNATVTGWWGTKGGHGSFAAKPSGTPGLYVMSVPRRVVGTTEETIKAVCTGASAAVEDACQFLSGSGSLSPVEQKAFSDAVKLVCLQVAAINPAAGATCASAVVLVELICKVPTICDNTIQAVDWAIGLKETITVGGLAVAEGIHRDASGNFPSPYQNTFIKVEFPSLVDRVEVTPASATLRSGKTSQLTSRVIGLSGNELKGRKVEWSSSDQTVATVNQNGLVTASEKQGSATITARTGGKSGVAQVQVSSMTISPEHATTVSMGGGPIPSRPNIRFAVSGGKAPYTWKISNGMMGAIDAGTGLYIAQRHMGTATISVHDADGNSATTTVTVTTSDIMFTGYCYDQISPVVYIDQPSVSISNGTISSFTNGVARVSVPVGDHVLKFTSPCPKYSSFSLSAPHYSGSNSLLIDGRTNVSVYPVGPQTLEFRLTRIR